MSQIFKMIEWELMQINVQLNIIYTIHYINNNIITYITPPIKKNAHENQFQHVNIGG